MNSEISQRFFDEINTLSGDSDFYNEAIRKKHPNGIKRLAHLVPEIAPDQAALAQLLAEFAVEHRKDEFTSGESLQAYQDYVNARGNKTKIKLLAKNAPNDPISWEAPFVWTACVFRSKVATDSGGSLPPIPVKSATPETGDTIDSIPC